MDTEGQVAVLSDRAPDPSQDASWANMDPQWAWEPYQPDVNRPWTKRLAGHLYRRAAFGAKPHELERALAIGPEESVAHLLRPDDDVAAFDQQYDQDEDAISRSGGIEGPRAWWLRRIIATPHPLQEKMTLFWHSHFGMSNQRVKSPLLMIQHIRTLREHALGSYAQMLKAATQDPAVLLGLDAASSRRSDPNENLSHQLMERLSVGPGHYGEEDVREAARAFTGWFVMRSKLRYFKHEHDPGTKNVLGQQGDWQADDVLQIVLAQPATAQLLVRKLCRWLISEQQDPPRQFVEPLAIRLAKEYDVGHVVETILRSNLFFSGIAYRQRIKSPVDFAVGVIRAIDGPVSTQRLGLDLAALGQDLYSPPTSHGWIGGRHWIDAATMIGRANLAAALLAADGAYGGKLNVRQVLGQPGPEGSDQATEAVLDLFLQGDASDGSRQALLEHTQTNQQKVTSEWLREFTYRVLTLSEFQLS